MSKRMEMAKTTDRPGQYGQYGATQPAGIGAPRLQR